MVQTACKLYRRQSAKIVCNWLPPRWPGNRRALWTDCCRVQCEQMTTRVLRVCQCSTAFQMSDFVLSKRVVMLDVLFQTFASSKTLPMWCKPFEPEP
eukprot:241908-Prymnesium_polylepis.1